MAKSKAFVQQKGDSQLVRDLIELHEKLNEGGKHWTKGAFFRREKRKGETVDCRCLVGGIGGVAKSGTTRNNEMVDALFDALSKKPNVSYEAHVTWTVMKAPRRALLTDRKKSVLIRFNDAHGRRWRDIEALIARAIRVARSA